MKGAEGRRSRAIGGRATFYRADPAEPLDVAVDAAFDRVLDHVEGWRPVFVESVGPKSTTECW